MFAQIQSAYEILSDPQERAWYDSHRNVIFRGNGGAPANHYEHDVRITTTEDIMKMLPKVNACREFSNSDSSFYSMLRNAFDTLSREEQLACEWENLEPIVYPGFGNANDQYDPTVRSFYSAWSTFATRKAFSWADVYRYSEAPDRRVRRLMEKENKRIREEAVREFNDAVRSLVAFVKKRDPRFKPSSQSEADRQKVLRDAAAAQAARSRAANLAKAGEGSSVPQWARTEDPGSSDDNNSIEEKPKELYECIVCHKSFKSEKQFEAHERSKKHVKAALYLRREMQIDDEKLHLASSNQEESGSVSPSSPSTRGCESDTLKSDAIETGVSDLVINEGAYSRTPDVLNSEDTGTTSTIEPHSGHLANPVSASPSEDEYADWEDIERRITGQQEDPSSSFNHTEVSDKTNGSTEARSSNEDNDLAPQPKVGKAKAKRSRKAAQKSNEPSSGDTQVS